MALFRFISTCQHAITVFVRPHLFQKQHDVPLCATGIPVEFIYLKKGRGETLLQYHRAADKQHRYLFQTGAPKPSPPRFLSPDPPPSYSSAWAAENSS